MTPPTLGSDRSDILSLFHDRATESNDVDAMVSERLNRFLYSELAQEADLARVETWFQDTQIPDGAQPVADYIKYLFEKVVPHSVKTHSPRFIGHMTSSLPSFVDPLGRIMTALNQNVVKLETSNAFTFYERQALAIIHRLIYAAKSDFYETHVQRRESTLGMIVSGGTLANVAALWCARNMRLGAKSGFAGIEAEGLGAALEFHGYKRAVVIGSSLMHYSLEKAADLLGIGRRALVRLPASQEGTIDPRQLEQTLEKCRAEKTFVIAVVGIAGTTETGAVDPLGEMAELAAKYGTHLHVDAAWGGPVLFSRKYAARLAGIERADSVTIDGHKQLYLPMGLGMVLFRDPECARSIETVANYIVRTGSADLGRRTLEGSRPAMAIFLHGALHIIGRAGYESLVDDGIEKCRFLADAIAARPEFELLAQPHLNILNYRYVPAALRERVHSGKLDEAANATLNEVNRRLQEIQRDTGWSFISRTILSNTRYGATPPITTLRAVLANPLTTRDDITAVLEEQVRVGDRIPLST